MIRSIDRFHQDDAGDWVAELSCLHNQHVRHNPPWQTREWVLTEDGRASRIGAELECPLCDRAELPDGLIHARTAGPFDENSLPKGLLRDHRVAERTWGLVRVVQGRVGFSLQTQVPYEVVLEAGQNQPIPPEVVHSLELRGPVLVAVDFLVR